MSGRGQPMAMIRDREHGAWYLWLCEGEEAMIADAEAGVDPRHGMTRIVYHARLVAYNAFCDWHFSRPRGAA